MIQFSLFKTTLCGFIFYLFSYSFYHREMEAFLLLKVLSKGVKRTNHYESTTVKKCHGVISSLRRSITFGVHISNSSSPASVSALLLFSKISYQSGH